MAIHYPLIGEAAVSCAARSFRCHQTRFMPLGQHPQAWPERFYDYLLNLASYFSTLPQKNPFPAAAGILAASVLIPLPAGLTQKSRCSSRG
jgi:hypothetical protein